MTALSPADGGPRVEVARLWRGNRLLRATRCRLRAIRWAQTVPGSGGAVVMIDETAVSRSFGAEAVIDVHTAEGMKRCGLTADSKLGQTWREDLAVMLAVPGVSRWRGHVIHELKVDSLALPVKCLGNDPGEAVVEMSDGEVLVADTARLGRYNDEVAAAYRTHSRLRGVDEGPGARPNPPATDADLSHGRVHGDGDRDGGGAAHSRPGWAAGPRGPGIDAGRGPRRAKWGVTSEGEDGPVWVYFLDDKGGFRADWVLVWATPHPDLGLTRARIRYVGRYTQHNEPGWGEGFCGVTCRGEENLQPPLREVGTACRPKRGRLG